MKIWAQAVSPHQRHLKKVVNALNRAYRERGHERRSLNLTIIDDGGIEELNRQFLDRRGATDVIAFPGDEALLGEIAVSGDTARRQARERGVPMENELMLLAVHGMLHLLGHDDGTLGEWRAMRIAEFETMVKVI